LSPPALGDASVEGPAASGEVALAVVLLDAVKLRDGEKSIVSDVPIDR
jgi:hypothetical protein